MQPHGCPDFTNKRIDAINPAFYLLKVVEVLFNLREARRLLTHFPLQSYQIYVLLYVSPATMLHSVLIL